MSGEHTVLRYNRIPFHAAEGETILQRVERHWEQMCSKDGLPSRASLSPEPLDTALSHCFILERVAPEVARFRVAGRDLTELLGAGCRRSAYCRGSFAHIPGLCPDASEGSLAHAAAG